MQIPVIVDACNLCTFHVFTCFNVFAACFLLRLCRNGVDCHMECHGLLDAWSVMNSWMGCHGLLDC